MLFLLLNNVLLERVSLLPINGVVLFVGSMQGGGGSKYPSDR
jgi:hypothetical protein